MSEERSPCLECERLKENKVECAGSCERLDRYQERQPHFSLWRGEPTYYVVPGLERTSHYRSRDQT